jgi:hypothetical protein
MDDIETFRDPALSLWQSAIHEVIARKQPHQARRLSSTHPVMRRANAAAKPLDRSKPNPIAAFAAAILHPIASAATHLALAKFRGNRLAKLTAAFAALVDRFRFGPFDPLWVEALVQYEKFLAARGAIPYRSYTNLGDFVLPLPAKDPLVIAVIADWGTGTTEAKQLLADVASRRPDLLIHLGDIYYSGTPREAEENFHTLVRGQFPDLPIYTLSGNHEMYSGGDGYYALLDQLGQKASFFCLRNAKWQVLALDTGLHDSDVFTVNSNLTYLEPSEAAWHQDKLRNAGGRKTILLSHHQLFTAFGDGVGQDATGRALAVNPKLYATFTEQGLSLDRIALWLWGHEHNFVVFAPYLGLARGRCIGAGAVPVDVATAPYAVNRNLAPPPGLAELPRPDEAAELASVAGCYDHCYATVTLSGATARVEYYQVSLDTGRSAVVFSEEIA